jgi:hypothetical protein
MRDSYSMMTARSSKPFFQFIHVTLFSRRTNGELRIHTAPGRAAVIAAVEQARHRPVIELMEYPVGDAP